MFRRYAATLLILLPLIVAAAGTAAAGENSIPPGTVITAQNWQQYKEFMPDGMQVLFAGTPFWKMPPDFRMEIGPTSSYPLPDAYLENTKKYSHLVQIKDLPGGGHTIDGYVAGLPFPEPAEPLKGYKILVNLWYRYVPYLFCGNDDHRYLITRSGQVTGARWEQVFRRLSHISAVGQPINDPRAQGIDYSEYAMQLDPEQDKYTEILTLYYVDPTKPEDDFVFVPKLRRVIRQSSNSRCAPISNSDFTPDDLTGFNGGIARFQATYLRDQQILMLLNASLPHYGDLSNYYGMFFPKPQVGKWEVRDSYVIDTRRIPSLQAGYCYGKQIMWIDKHVYSMVWKDVYNSKMRLFKIGMFEKLAAPVPREGIQVNGGNGIEAMWDMDKQHLTVFITNGPNGKGLVANEACRNVDGNNYDDVQRYSTVGGLPQVMR
jgi:Protein of unknown function (DUF1329)